MLVLTTVNFLHHDTKAVMQEWKEKKKVGEETTVYSRNNMS